MVAWQALSDMKMKNSFPFDLDFVFSYVTRMLYVQ